MESARERFLESEKERQGGYFVGLLSQELEHICLSGQQEPQEASTFSS